MGLSRVPAPRRSLLLPMLVFWMAMVLLPRQAVASSAEPSQLQPELEWNGDTRELDAANDALSEIIREALEGKSRSRDGALVRPTQLPDLYYHEEKYEITVTAERVAAATRADWTVVQAEAYLEQQHADVELLLPRIEVAGRYVLDRKAHGDFSSREEGVFTMVMQNVSAGGLAEVRVQHGALVLGRVLLALHPENERFEATRERGDASMRAFSEKGDFERGLRRRVWRDLTALLETAARERLRPALVRRPLKEVLPNAKQRTRLEEYEDVVKESADGFVDLLLGAARTLLGNGSADRLPLPDLREGFERKVLFVTVRGGFVATDGYVDGLTSAHRNGDSFFAHHPNGSGFNIWGGIAFEDLSLTYEHYEAQVMGLGPTGSLTAEVYPLALHVHLRVDFDEDRVSLEEFRIDEAGELQVEVTELGFVLNWLASRVATWLLAAYRDRIVDELQTRYARYFSDTLARTSVDELINGHLY